MNHIQIGEVGEILAVKYLLQRGYKILAQRYRTKTGEIDIVASDQDCFVFVEVKTRRSTYCGNPAEAVTWQKQRKIVKTALWYLQSTGNMEMACRFDVMEIIMKNSTTIEYNHIKNAFSG